MRGAVSPQDQISELNKKLQLHEGDLKAYIEVCLHYLCISQFIYIWLTIVKFPC